MPKGQKTCVGCQEVNPSFNKNCQKCNAVFEKRVNTYIPTGRPRGRPKKNTENLVLAAPRPEKTKATTEPVKFNPSYFADSPGVFNLDPGSLFRDLYGKDAQIDLIMSALRTYNDTMGQDRLHTLLVGDPSGGKSEITKRIIHMVGQENVLAFDGHSATVAGISNEILEYPGNLPPLLVIQEIEKSKADLSWLLGVLDTAAELVKVTARDGIRRRRVPFLCLATCNSLEKLESMHSKSIADRFIQKVFVKPMDEKTLFEMMKQEVRKIPDFSYSWIPEAIRLGKKRGDMSVRAIKGILLSGRERLLDGSYEKILAETAIPNHEEGTG